MKSALEFSEQEKAWSLKIRQLYNAGKPEESVPEAVAFLKAYPASLRARYDFAVQHGDWSYHPDHSSEKSAELLAVAKEGLQELLNHPALTESPADFQKAVKNEYFWFFEKHEEQYNLGVSHIKVCARGGNYSACVGAAMLALKFLRHNQINESQRWAAISLEHFHAFEALDPEWYNLNFFAAQSAACLNRFEEARQLHSGMFRKQGQPDDMAMVKQFEVLLSEIKSLLEKTSH